MAIKKGKYEFDVALSFAGENRDIVEKFKMKLQSQGLKVFYDQDHRAKLWGKDAKEFERIFSTASRYVIPFISEDYVKKEWCRFEFAAAREEAKKRDEEFILPLRLDDTRLLGLNEDVFYIDLRKISISDVIKDLIVKMKPQAFRKVGIGGRTAHRVQILALNDRRLLGIIAVSPFPFTVKEYTAIFPETDWTKVSRSFRRKGLLKKGKGPLRLFKPVERTILSDPEETLTFHQTWVDAFEPIKEYSDVALALGFHYICLEQHDKAITIVASIVERLEPSWWNHLYIAFLKQIHNSPIYRRLNQESRVRFHNAMGLCLSHLGNYEKAIEWFLKLRRYSKSIGHKWGIGQSYINCGVAYFHHRDRARAKRCYKQTIIHAQKQKDRSLLAKAYNNLAMTILEEDGQEAEQLIEKSLQLKKVEDDVVGMVGAYMGCGILAIQRGDHLQAIKWYKRAERKARKLDLYHMLVLTLSNLGSAHVELKRYPEAFKYFREARHIADTEGYLDASIYVAQGEARGRVDTGEYVLAAELFKNLADMKEKVGDVEGQIIALHDQGVMLVKQGKENKGRQVLDNALKIAKRTNNNEWTFRCYVNKAFSYEHAGNTMKRIKYQKRVARKEQKAGSYLLAARLWEQCAYDLADIGQRISTEKAFAHCLESLDKIPNTQDEILQILKNRFLWRWDSRNYEQALNSLDEITTFASKHQKRKDKVHAIDQKGVCLQDLERFKDAEGMHRQALKLARGLGDDELIETSLNNLGELLRKTGRTQQALSMLGEAESLARKRQDTEAELSIASNRALALKGLDCGDEADKLLRSCRDRAKKEKLWYEYVNALHELANLAWMLGKKGLAERRYLKALSEAEAHKIEELKNKITFNYSRLLRNKNQSAEALVHLESIQDSITVGPNAHFYYMELAESHEAEGNSEDAKSNWIKAKEIAQHIGVHSQILHCASALAEIYRKELDLKSAEKEITSALQYEDDIEWKALLLRQYLEILLDANKDKKAEQIFDIARNIADENDFHEIYVDLHMLVGDNNWAEGEKGQFTALQAYIVGMAAAMKIDFVNFMKVGIHIFNRLREIGFENRVERFETINNQLRTWLQKDAEDNNERVIEWCLWPLSIAREFFQSHSQDRDLPDKTMRKLIEREFTRLENL